MVKIIFKFLASVLILMGIIYVVEMIAPAVRPIIGNWTYLFDFSIGMIGGFTVIHGVWKQ